MALGDLVQMLEGLPGSTGCAGCGLADVPDPAMPEPLDPQPKTDWTPYVLGGLGLLTVWALFFRETR